MIRPESDAGVQTLKEVLQTITDLGFALAKQPSSVLNQQQVVTQSKLFEHAFSRGTRFGVSMGPAVFERQEPVVLFGIADRLAGSEASLFGRFE